MVAETNLMSDGAVIPITQPVGITIANKRKRIFIGEQVTIIIDLGNMRKKEDIK